MGLVRVTLRYVRPLSSATRMSRFLCWNADRRSPLHETGKSSENQGNQVPKLEPHPHVCFACGLTNLKPAPCIPST